MTVLGKWSKLIQYVLVHIPDSGCQSYCKVTTHQLLLLHCFAQFAEYGWVEPLNAFTNLTTYHGGNSSLTDKCCRGFKGYCTDALKPALDTECKTKQQLLSHLNGLFHFVL